MISFPYSSPLRNPDLTVNNTKSLFKNVNYLWKEKFPYIYGKEFAFKKIEVSFWSTKTIIDFKSLIISRLNREFDSLRAPLESVTEFTKKH